MQDMPRKLPLHVTKERTRHGRVVFYFRIDKGPRTRLPDNPDSQEFKEAYRALLAGGEIPDNRAPHTKSKTLAWLVARYQESAGWRSLSPATQKQRRHIFDDAIKRADNPPFSRITAQVIRKSMDARSETPAQANNLLKALRGLFKWAHINEHVEADPTVGIKPLRYKSDGFTAWTPADAQHFCDYWKIGTMPRLAFELFACSGVRRGDLHIMGPQHVKGRTLYMRTQKKGVPITITLTNRAMEAIEQTPTGDLHFIVKDNGSPFSSKESFGNWFGARCREAGLEPGKSAHGIRKLAATLAANGGASTHELMAHFGWQTSAQAETYTRNVDRARLGGASSARLAEEIENSLPRTPASGAGRNGK